MQIEFVSPDAGLASRTVLAIAVPEGEASSVRGGAFAYLLKPFPIEEALRLAGLAMRQVALRREREALLKQLQESDDPTIAPGTGTPVPGGINYREAQLVMEMIADSGRLGSLDIVEVNTALDQGNATAELAVDLVESLFGKSTLMRD